MDYGILMLSTTLEEALALFDLEVVLLLLSLSHLSPLEVVSDLIQNIIQFAHFLQPVHSSHLLRILLIGRVGLFSIQDVLMLALVDELQFLVLFWCEGE